ncbi:MAG TPA: L-aspartate oxidase [Vicinamibacterales bacterium]|nr:L-aspartate oxidase [Vicinamibacterales bacterium]
MDLRADFLIIGSGIAALRAAAELSGAGDILVLTKAEPEEGNTGYAQGGVAAALGPDDSPALHGADTIAAGDGLCDERAVEVLVNEGPACVRELMEWGARFDLEADGTPALAIEGAHSARRVLHARDATGREMGRVLWGRASTLPGITILAHARVVELIVEDGRCAGARYIGDDGECREARAGAVLLATGGAGQVYRETTNPAVATGDGVAMAYRAGADVADLEFVQFHPTALKVEGQPRFLLSEALRGEGARLLNADGEAFMARYEAAGDLASRDRVSRAIAREEARTGRPVYLSLQQLDPAYVHSRFPLIAAACRRARLDLARDPIPVGPAAHYMMGGVATDLDGRTTLAGLYAAGEAACTGVHGANRLASNSLLEGLVFGARAGRAMKVRGFRGSKVPSFEGSAVPRFASETPRNPGTPEPWNPGSLEPWNPGPLGDVMWRDVGLFRERETLQRAVETLDEPWRLVLAHLRGGGRLEAAQWRTANLLTVARLIARAALRREESRGAHYRQDYPRRDDINWNRRIADRN